MPSGRIPCQNPPLGALRGQEPTMPDPAPKPDLRPRWALTFRYGAWLPLGSVTYSAARGGWVFVSMTQDGNSRRAWPTPEAAIKRFKTARLVVKVQPLFAPSDYAHLEAPDA